MAASSYKFPLERRREARQESTEHLPFQVPQRRESDVARMRFQRWMELAEAALREDRYRDPFFDENPTESPTQRKAA